MSHQRVYKTHIIFAAGSLSGFNFFLKVWVVKLRGLPLSPQPFTPPEGEVNVLKY